MCKAQCADAAYYIWYMIIAKGISVDSDVINGRPAVAGTRIAVESILNYLAAGDSVEDILEAFPQLNEEMVRDCLAFAASMLGNMEAVRISA